MTKRALTMSLALALRALPASPQVQLPQADVLRGGVPAGEKDAAPIDLTLEQAITRGLEHNLGAILGQEQVREAEGEHGGARSDLLPHVRAASYALRQKVSLAAFGFSGFGDFPELIGPFTVVDARGFVSQTVFDWHAIRHSQSEGSKAKAAAEQLRSTRD